MAQRVDHGLVLGTRVLGRLIVLICARRALAADDDAGMDESPISDVAVLKNVRVRTRVPERGGAELVDGSRLMEIGDHHEGSEELPFDIPGKAGGICDVQFAAQFAQLHVEFRRMHSSIIAPESERRRWLR